MVRKNGHHALPAMVQPCFVVVIMVKSMVNYGNHSHHFEGILCSCGKIIHLLLYLIIRNEDAQELSQPYF